MTARFRPIERWSSAAGLRLLRQLAEERVDADEVFPRLNLPAWESGLIRRALKAPEGFASPSINARLRNTRRGFFAAVLDDFRDMARASPPLARSQRNFRGVRAHLDRLARSVRDPTDE